MHLTFRYFRFFHVAVRPFRYGEENIMELLVKADILSILSKSRGLQCATAATRWLHLNHDNNYRGWRDSLSARVCTVYVSQVVEPVANESKTRGKSKGLDKPCRFSHAFFPPSLILLFLSICERRAKATKHRVVESNRISQNIKFNLFYRYTMSLFLTCSSRPGERPVLKSPIVHIALWPGIREFEQ